jgi:hypothetical protein
MPVHRTAGSVLGLTIIAGIGTAAAPVSTGPRAVEPRVCVSYMKGSDDDRRSFLREFRSAAAVFTGRVVEVDRVRVRLQADWFWKGEPEKDIVLSTGMPAEPNVWIEDTYEFALGHEYLVFAYLEPSGGMQTDACSRTRPAESAGDTIRALEKLAPHKVAK